MLAYQGTLQTIAELSIALAGFTGVVVALGRRGQGEWAAVERARLESLLQAAVGGVVFSIAPSVALSAGVSDDTIWRVGNAVLCVVHALGALRFLRQIGPETWQRGEPERILIVLLPIPAVLILGQFSVAVGILSGFGPFFYLATLLWVLVVGLLQFVFLLIRTRPA